MNSQKKLRGISREDAMKPITDFVEPLPDSKHQYWLCCGCTDIRHNYQCVEVKSKNFEICRYGTAKEHSEWQLSLARPKLTCATTQRAEAVAQKLRQRQKTEWWDEIDREAVFAIDALVAYTKSLINHADTVQPEQEPVAVKVISKHTDTQSTS